MKVANTTQQRKLRFLLAPLWCSCVTIPEDNEAEYIGDDNLYFGLTCSPAKAGECGLRISFVVDDEILWEPHPSDDVIASLCGDPVVILASENFFLL